MTKAEEAKCLVDSLEQLLAEGGFEISQWSCNISATTEHLPPAARSTASDLWLSKSSSGLQTLTLGMQWNCLTLGYKQQSSDFASVRSCSADEGRRTQTLDSQVGEGWCLL